MVAASTPGLTRAYELTRADVEAYEIEAEALQEQFRIALTKHPELAALRDRWMAARQRALDARRAWREVEATEHVGNG